MTFPRRSSTTAAFPGRAAVVAVMPRRGAGVGSFPPAPTNAPRVTGAVLLDVIPALGAALPIPAVSGGHVLSLVAVDVIRPVPAVDGGQTIGVTSDLFLVPDNIDGVVTFDVIPGGTAFPVLTLSGRVDLDVLSTADSYPVAVVNGWLGLDVVPGANVAPVPAVLAAVSLDVIPAATVSPVGVVAGAQSLDVIPGGTAVGVTFQPSGMNKVGTQNFVTAGAWMLVTGWSADTTNYPGSTIVSNGLDVQGSKASATVNVSLPYTGSFSNAHTARILKNGVVVATGTPVSTNSGTMTASWSGSVVDTDVFTVEAKLDTYVNGSVSANGYVRIT